MTPVSHACATRVVGLSFDLKGFVMGIRLAGLAYCVAPS